MTFQDIFNFQDFFSTHDKIIFHAFSYVSMTVGTLNLHYKPEFFLQKPQTNDLPLPCGTSMGGLPPAILMSHGMGIGGMPAQGCGPPYGHG